METPIVIMWTLLNVALPLSNAITCSEIGQCEYDSHAYGNAHAKGDITTLCNLLGKSVSCMDVAMNDCQKNANFPENRLNQAQQVLEKHKQQVLALCPGPTDTTDKLSGPEDYNAGHAMKEQDRRGLPKNPVCKEIMDCMFDLVHFKTALNADRLTEACRLINPSVKCLRQAIKDCKDKNIIDQEDIANATHSLTDAEKLLETFCGLARDKENAKNGINPEMSEKKQAQMRNNNTAATNSQEHSNEKAKQENADSSYKAVEENNNSDGSSSSQNGGQNRASLLTISLRFLFLVLFVNIGGLNNLLFHKMLYTDIIPSF